MTLMDWVMAYLLVQWLGWSVDGVAKALNRVADAIREQKR